MTLDEYKAKKTETARQWSTDGLLTISQVMRLFHRSESCIRKWCDRGRLEKVKENEDISRSPVYITLQSVIDWIEKFNFV